MGSKKEYPIKIISELVLQIARINNISLDKIVFYGSSGAAFAGLAASRYIKGSTAVAINPQVNALKYYKDHVRDMKQICFNNMDDDKLLESYSERLNMVQSYKKGFNNKVLLVQNTLDKFHYENHYLPFIQNINSQLRKSSTRVESVLYSCKSGHGPESIFMIYGVMDKVRELNCNN